MTTTSIKPPLLMRPLSRAQLQMLDVFHAILVGLVCLFAAAETPIPPASGWREPSWITLLAAVLLAVPTLIRRRWPLIATAMVVVVAASALVTGVVPDYASAGPIIAVGMVLYIVGASVIGPLSLVTAAAGVAVMVTALTFSDDSSFGPGAAKGGFGLLVPASCWALGWTVRERRLHAARRVEEATARAVDEERLRIAREVHDIVAHNMSLIAVKATVANHVADDRPDEVRDALRVIEAMSRSALVELSRAVGSMRAPGVNDPVPDQPDLAVLIKSAESAGLRVELVRNGSEEMPPGLDTAVFRIVQEALTNVIKHAAATRCRVTIDARDGEVRVKVVNDGAGRGGGGSGREGDGAGRGGGGSDRGSEEESAGGGQGLVGMRERVELYGGELHAGPGPDGTWVVRARLEAVR